VYLKHWNLRHFPFEDASGPAYLFESDTHRGVFEELSGAIMRRKGAIMLTGDIGCGKTIMSQRALLRLPEERFDIALITYPRLDPVEMLREINQQLGLEAVNMDKGELLHALQQHLASNATSDRDTIICIDEAQSIPSIAGFDELRLLLNFQLPNRFLITLIFVGQPELQGKIARLHALQQRIALRLHLGPFSPQDTARYLLHRLHAAGNNRAILTRQAADAIYQHSGGVPRRINHLADCCLMLGMRKDSSVLNSCLVYEAMERYSC